MLAGTVLNQGDHSMKQQKLHLEILYKEGNLLGFIPITFDLASLCVCVKLSPPFLFVPNRNEAIARLENVGQQNRFHCNVPVCDTDPACSDE